MGRVFSMSLLCLSLAVAIAHADEEPKRQLGPHEHGHGNLNIAIEGTRVTMELAVPGADIVGFEHKAMTKREKAARDAARKALSSPLDLFVVSAEADCTLTKSKVEIASEGGGGDGSTRRHVHKNEQTAGNGKARENGEHSEFRAIYDLMCRNPDKLTTLTFNYFDVFKRARELVVQVISPKQQSRYDVTRKVRTIVIGSGN